MSSAAPLAPAPALYAAVLRARLFDERMDAAMRGAGLTGLDRRGRGSEAMAAGVGCVLRDGDAVAGTAPGHRWCLAAGTSPDRLAAELLGRAHGVCGGRAGPDHVADPEHGCLGTAATAGLAAGIAAGAALAARRAGHGTRVAVAFLGASAAAGPLADVVVAAVHWRLPVLLVAEGDRFGGAAGLPSEEADAADVDAIAAAAARAVGRARSGGGPSLLRCSAAARDPLDVLAARLHAADVARARERVETEVDLAVEFGLRAPAPMPAGVAGSAGA